MSWAPDADDEPDRFERIVEDVRDRPDVADVRVDDETIKIFFEETNRLPDGFDEWADANALSIRDFVILPDDEGFVVGLEFIDTIEALSPHHHAAEGLRPYFEAGVPPAAALDAWMADRGPFSQAEWARFRGVGRQTVGDRVRNAREQAPKERLRERKRRRRDDHSESPWWDLF